MDKERLFRYLNQKYYSKCEMASTLPLGMNPDEIWNTVLEDRLKKAIRLPLKNANGDYYWYVLTNKMISASETIVEELMCCTAARQAVLQRKDRLRRTPPRSRRKRCR